MSEWTVGGVEQGVRLDKYLVTKTGLSGHNIKRLLDNGKVKVNGKRVVIAKWEVLEGDDIRVDLGGFVAEKEPATVREHRHEDRRQRERPQQRHGREEGRREERHQKQPSSHEKPAHEHREPHRAHDENLPSEAAAQTTMSSAIPRIGEGRPEGLRDRIQKPFERRPMREKRPPREHRREVKPAGVERSGDFVEVIFEDRDIIVVNKPSGVVVLSEKGEGKGPSLIDRVKKYLKRKHKESQGSFVRAVHRLDKETSGVIVMAKSRAGAAIEQQFRQHRVDKHYLAIVEGRVEKEQGRITLPIGKGDFGHGRKAGVVAEGEGAAADTEYGIKELYGKATLVTVRMHTGRTHQIRVHMSAIGHPIVGDKIYGPNGEIKFSRQALHAERIAFTHPVQRKRVEFKSPMPKDMVELVDQLRSSV